MTAVFEDGTVALVTGAGRGLGAEYATALAAAGATVAVHARTARAAGAVADRIRDTGARTRSSGTRATAVPWSGTASRRSAGSTCSWSTRAGCATAGCPG